jgi:hypothetical protein
MFKRRLAVLGTVAVLALTGLAGSAMADDPSTAPDRAKVTCKTTDGKIVKFGPGKAGKSFVTSDGKAGKSFVTSDGKAVKKGDLPPLPDEGLPAVAGKPGLELQDSEGAELAAPARASVQLKKVKEVEGDEAPPKGLAKSIKIMCTSRKTEK